MTAAALLNTVRAHGMRVSSARRNVLDALLNADGVEQGGGGHVAVP